MRTLADEDEQVARRIDRIARDHLSDVDPEEVADVLYSELGALEVEAVWERAGRKRHGYVEPAEAAYKMVEEVQGPFLDELRKYQKLGMSVEATQLCIGLLMGLHRFERESRSEFKDWAVDAPISFAEQVVRAWKMGRPNPSDLVALRESVEAEVGEWGRNLL